VLYTGRDMRNALIALLILSGFYLMTAKVYQEGDFGVDLVVKPYPSWPTAVGGGEEGAWQRDHPGESPPWWQRGNYILIIQDDWEGGIPWWVEVYDLGYLAVLIDWLVLGGAWGAHHVSRRLHAPR
jgi:hypothetical protein